MAALEDILRLVLERRGVDFSSYRRATVERRVLGRMRALFVDGYPDYLRILEMDEAEAGRLVERITIKVSAFFRDPEVFSQLEAVVLPELLRRAAGRTPRVWVAGCANGEEPYSLAMLLDEADPGRRRPRPSILATDIDVKALEAAVSAAYPEDALEGLDEERRGRYFRQEGDGPRLRHVLSDGIREYVRFAYHDLASGQAPPGDGPFDLVCCRNVLIYFAADLRERAQRLVGGEVGPGGYLCLGTSEWLVPSLEPSFRVVDRGTRLFERARPREDRVCENET